MTDVAPRLTPAEQIHAKIIRRAENALEDIRRRHLTSRAPDLRTVDNRLDAAVQLLGIVRSQLHELNTLGNDRPRAAERLNVQGGSRDYALDTHGDPRARELYRQVALELLSLIELTTVAAHTMHSWLRTGEIDTASHRGAQVVTSDEFLAALAAQSRRLDRGEGETPTVDQPSRKATTDLDTLQRRIRDLEGVLGKLIPRLTSTDRGRLTTSEQLAHRTSVDAHRARREARGARTL